MGLLVLVLAQSICSDAASEQPGSGWQQGGGLTMTRVPEDPDVLKGTPGLRQAAGGQTYQTQRL